MHKKYRFGIIGSFVRNKPTFSGQAVKTRNFAGALEDRFGKDRIFTVDTHGWKKHPIKLVFGIIKAINNSEEIAILPADRGVFVIPALTVLCRGFRKTKIHYIGVGGWLPEFVKDNKRLNRTMHKMYGIYLETNTLKEAMESQGFTNVTVLPNFKKLAILDADNLVYTETMPLKICTFSRVMKEKGIGDIVAAVNLINSSHQSPVYSLDIYGKVDSAQENWFEELCGSFTEQIKYMGAIPPENSTEVLKDYFALIFPTKYRTEGIPGTIIDAYTAGVPVIASKWDSYLDVVDDGKTGLCYEFDNVTALEQTLGYVANNPEKLNELKNNCLVKAKYFDSNTAINILLNF